MTAMILPEAVRGCVDALEAAGFAAYAVGGCVRDALLGLTPHDYDLCTSATPAQLRQVFSGCRLVLAGEKHGTVGVVTAAGVVEITTFRTEGGYRDSRHPDWVRFVPRVEDDLARRDFTVNAMAYSPSRGFADPFGGRADLQNRILRAVGEPETRFREDALRILRAARFAARYGLTLEAATAQAAESLLPLTERLARERVYEELCKLICVANTADFLRFAAMLAYVIPELGPTLHFDQHNPHHAYDLYTHIAHVVGAVPPELPLRWAALLHDIGKPAAFTQDETGRGHFYGHAQLSADMADGVLRRLKAPNALRERVTLLIAQHMTLLEPDKRLLRRRLGQYGQEAVEQLLALQQADFGGKGTGVETDDNHFCRVAGLLRELEAEAACLTVKDLAVHGRELMALGIPQGPELGRCLAYLLEQVQLEALPNAAEALLAAAAHWWEADRGN